jgi:hypothetical protein
MARTGKYCKAYPVSRFEGYHKWNDAVKACKQRQEGASADPQSETASVGYFFLQEDYTVTDGIFLDEKVVFDSVTNEWKEFCHDALGFELPPDLRAEEAATSGENNDS